MQSAKYEVQNVGLTSFYISYFALFTLHFRCGLATQQALEVMFWTRPRRQTRGQFHFRTGKPCGANTTNRSVVGRRLCQYFGHRRDLPVEIGGSGQSAARGQNALDDETGRLRTRNCTGIMPPRRSLPLPASLPDCGESLVVKVFRMNEIITLELTKDQKEILLRGLRYVRSSIMLDINDLPTTESQDERSTNLRQVTELTEHVSRAAVMAH